MRKTQNKLYARDTLKHTEILFRQELRVHILCFIRQVFSSLSRLCRYTGTHVEKPKSLRLKGLFYRLIISFIKAANIFITSHL